MLHNASASYHADTKDRHSSQCAMPLSHQHSHFEYTLQHPGIVRSMLPDEGRTCGFASVANDV